jgi:putative SOS response-associated peptidase YedK
MCGRYDLDATAEELAARFGVPTRELSVNLNVKSGWQPRYNIAPSQDNPVIVREGSVSSGSGEQNQLALMQWGLVPSWAKEAKIAYSTINARAETVASKPAFRKPLIRQRCLVPATGYYEWADGTQSAAGVPDVSAAMEGTKSPRSRGKQPFRIRLWGEGLDKIFAFAGLYDIWQGPGGQELHTYTIVTTGANDALSSLHSRMPVILPRDIEDAWLDRGNRDLEELISLLQPYPGEAMTAYRVPTLVNSPMNEGRELIEPLSRLAA